MPQENRFYSDEAQEVLGKIPSWIIRWGVSVIFIIFAGIVIGSYFMKFPQVLTAPITITSTNPPSDLIAKSNGRIESILWKEGELVAKGDVVAYLHTTAAYNDICCIEKELELLNDTTFSFLSKEYKMGEMQNGFSEFRNYCVDYLHYIKAKDISLRIKLLQVQIEKYGIYLTQQKEQRGILSQDLELTRKDLKRDSLLLGFKAITPSDFDRSTQALLQKKSSLLGFDASITNAELNVLKMQQQLTELRMQHNNEIAQHTRLITESKWRLLAQIKQWKSQYVLTAPIDGKLTFTKYWSKNQNVIAGDVVSTVLPVDSVIVIGLMTIPSSGFGKVALGQVVNVKLNGYPYQEYGVLKGTIVRISSVPDENGYIAEINFLNGLQSTYKEQLKFIQKMDGTGDIITKDMRLIERFIQPMKALFDRAEGN